MPSIRFHGRMLLAALSATLLAASATPALAAPAAAEVTASRARVEQAVQRLEAARERRDRVEAELAQTSERLDRIVAEQSRARGRLTTRARGMYRSGDVTFVSVLLGAATFEDFTSRWQLLTRMNEGDAEAIRRLELSRSRARTAAERLLRLQEESARSADAIEREVARARRELAADQTALRAYRARVNARPRIAEALSAEKPAEKRVSRPQPGGRGAWKTAVASHYGINFRGRGASGDEIGPYSMMCAHKTLPFGTLVEFEYGGKRAVAKVADRGPHVAGREFDLGPGVARVLSFSGVHEVRWRVIER